MNRVSTKPETVVFTIRVPRHISEDFAKICDSYCMSMNEVANTFLRLYVDAERAKGTIE